MKKSRYLPIYVFLAAAFWSVAIAAPVVASEVTEAGKRLSVFLDNLGVKKLGDDGYHQSRWLPGIHVDFFSGVPDGKNEGTLISHCTASVGATALALNAPIMTPAENADESMKRSEYLLSNALYVWFNEKSSAYGWHQVAEKTAQRNANRGCLAIAIINGNVRADGWAKPGHVTVIRPSEKSDQLIEAEGAQVVNVGKINNPNISRKDAFAAHIKGLSESVLAKRMRFYAHTSVYCSKVEKRDEDFFEQFIIQ